MEWIQTNWEHIVAITGAIVTLASLVVKLTPAQNDDETLGKVVNVLKALSLAK